MSKLKLLVACAISLTIYCSSAFVSQVYANTKSAPLIDPGIKQSLVKICEAIQTNNKFKLRSAIRNSGISERAIAKGLVCNGMGAMSFAMSTNANKTADYLAKKGFSKKRELLTKN